MKTIYKLASFEGDDTFHFLDHEMQQFWRDTKLDGSEKILIRTQHLFKFYAPTLHDDICKGCMMEIDGVTLFVEDKGEKYCIAIGDEWNL